MTENKKMSLAEYNRAKSTMKVEEALKKLKKSRKPITIASVAATAGIARKTLYNRPDLKELVEIAISLQEDQKAPDEAPKREKRKNGSLQAERIEKLRAENKQLKEEKKKTLDQNGSLTIENQNLKRRIYDLEQYIQQIQASKITKLNKDS